ncbi:hypothetical protein BTHE68_39810 [Burkholderia sp. THE68]|uniref:DUF4148 domain-containing protein n=1 Tax=Burkholderiaceae TaxID=119060 RepID=UPI0013194F86|nr:MULTISPECIES: DUF4148 domain-containing protein [Burkholderiaceae]BBU30247.1 hypothetical protein BTHE68_39810 [Burkholderia sp. THE68]BCQ26053.1 DUF4148 domain-containing protein [Caballeronia sp. NK8]
MKNTLIGGLVLSALLATAPAFAQSTFAGKSRAEVKAELATARSAGDLDAVNSLSYPQLRPYQERHAQLRTDMRNDGSSR